MTCADTVGDLLKTADTFRNCFSVLFRLKRNSCISVLFQFYFNCADSLIKLVVAKETVLRLIWQPDEG